MHASFIILFIYILFIARIVVVGAGRYALLRPGFKIIYWAIVVDFFSESIGLFLTTHWAEALCKEQLNRVDSVVAISYALLNFTLYLLFFNCTLPNMGFAIKRYQVLLALLLSYILVFTGTKNLFEVAYYCLTISSFILVLFSLYAIVYTLRHKEMTRIYFNFYLLYLFAFMIDIVVKGTIDILVIIYKFDVAFPSLCLHVALCTTEYILFYEFLFKQKKDFGQALKTP